MADEPNDPTQTPATSEPTGESDEQGDLSYEDAFAKLEQVLDALETGDLPLEESLALYELGATLATYCLQKLDEAELRVRQWQPGDETVPFEEWQEA